MINFCIVVAIWLRRLISTCLVVTFRSQDKEETRLVEFTWAGVEIEGGGATGTLLYMH